MTKGLAGALNLKAGEKKIDTASSRGFFALVIAGEGGEDIIKRKRDGTGD